MDKREHREKEKGEQATLQNPTLEFTKEVRSVKRIEQKQPEIRRENLGLCSALKLKKKSISRRKK